MAELMNITAEQIYDRLVNVDKIKNVKGQIRLNLGNVDIVVCQKDIVDRIIQEWVKGWLRKNKIAFTVNINVQMSEDICLISEDKRPELLVVKAFNYPYSPDFYIADLKVYAREIFQKPYMLHAKYLIFGYGFDGVGTLNIRKVWLMNVWEICSARTHRPLNIKHMNGITHKIIPSRWFGNRSKFSMFSSLEHYLSAIEETLFSYPDTHELSKGWRKKISDSYKDFYGKTITIPRWEELADLYQPKDMPK